MPIIGIPIYVAHIFLHVNVVKEGTVAKDDEDEGGGEWCESIN